MIGDYERLKRRRRNDKWESSIFVLVLEHIKCFCNYQMSCIYETNFYIFFKVVFFV